eukprot:772503-Rhodomonas_salina.1
MASALLRPWDGKVSRRECSQHAFHDRDTRSVGVIVTLAGYPNIMVCSIMVALTVCGRRPWS